MTGELLQQSGRRKPDLSAVTLAYNKRVASMGNKGLALKTLNHVVRFFEDMQRRKDILDAQKPMIDEVRRVQKALGLG